MGRGVAELGKEFSAAVFGENRPRRFLSNGPLLYIERDCGWSPNEVQDDDDAGAVGAHARASLAMTHDAT